MSDSVTLWTVSRQVPLSVGFWQEYCIQARIPQWVAFPCSRVSSQPRNRTHVSYISCLGRQVLYHQHHLGSPYAQIEHLLRILRARVVIWQNSAQNMGRWAAEIWWEFRLVKSPRNSGLYAWSSLPGREKPRILGLGWGPEALQSVQLRLCSKGAAQS